MSKINNYWNKNIFDKFDIFNSVDVRLEGIKGNLKDIKNIVAVVSPKGGVGKSTLIFLINRLFTSYK